MPIRKPLIVGNWKMNGDDSMARALVRGIGADVSDLKRVEVVACPPFVYLAAVGAAGGERSNAVRIGAQDVSEHASGAYTGEVSAAMLRELGCAYVIVGHSERRQYHGESDALVARKARSAQQHGMTPIFCVGETLEERKAGQARTVIESQLDAAIRSTPPVDLANLAVAYEPVWAIGTGVVADAGQVQEAHGWIRGQLRNTDAQAAENCRILYGGSVTGDNADNFIALPDIDGCLVGGASLRAEGFVRICSAANNWEV